MEKMGSSGGMGGMVLRSAQVPTRIQMIAGCGPDARLRKGSASRRPNGYNSPHRSNGRMGL